MQLSIALTLALVTVAHSQDATPKAQVKGSKEYVRAFQMIAERMDAEARPLIQQLDASKADTAAERLALESWMDFVWGQLDSARDKSQKALAKNPKQPLALMLLARLQASENLMDDAAKNARAAVEGDPDNPIILWWAAFMPTTAKKDLATRIRFIERVAAMGGTPEIQNSKELAKEALEFARKLGERPTEVVVKGTRAELPFTRDPMSGLCILQIPQPNGQRVRMILDTGANTMLTPTMAVQNMKSEFLAKSTAYALGGTVSMNRVLLDSFTIGDMELKSVVTVSSPNNSLLGMNLFRDMILVIDYKRNRLIAYKNADEFQKEWAADLKTAEQLPFRMFNNCVFLSAKFTSGGGKEREGMLFMDTGANITALNTTFATKWSKDSNFALRQGGAAPIMGAAGVGRQPMLFAPNVVAQSGKYVIQNPNMPSIDLSTLRNAMGFESSAIVGIRDIARYDFYIVDYPARKIYLGSPVGGR